MKLSKSGNAGLNNKQERDAQGESPEKQKNIKLPALLAGLLLGVILAVGVSYVLFDTQIVKEQDRQLDQLVQQKAELTASAVQDYFDSLIEKTYFFASQTMLRDALMDGDTATLDRAKQNITRQIKNVEAVAVFSRGEAKMDPERSPPIRFSELALIQSAENGEASRVEATKANDVWLLNLAVPIQSTTDDDVTGVVWLSFNTLGLKTVLTEGNENLGGVELFQKFSANSRPLVESFGTANLSNTATAKLGESYWEVQFSAAHGLKWQTHIDTAFVYLLMLVIMAILAGGCAAIGFWIGSKVDVARSRAAIEGSMPSAQIKRSSDGFMDPMYQSSSLMDVEVSQEDESLLGMEDDETAAAEDEDALSLDDDVFELDDDVEVGGFPEEVFRAYDIRGLAKEQIDKEFALCLGKALGTELLEHRENTLVVARDARTHSPQLTEWLVRGILSTGCNVLNIGTVPTPLMYFTIETMEEVTSGVMVTASHNAAPYNGFKLVINGVSRSGEDIQGIRRRMNAKKFSLGQGQEHHHDIVPGYVDAIFSDVALAGELDVVIDAGNGVAGKVAPKLFEELGCRVTPLYCDLDGSFPNHDPDPSVEANLQDLIRKVQSDNADIGIALDGDGDRLAVVSKTGKVYTADRMLMLFAVDIISRTPGADVIFDVKSTRHLNACIANAGGRPVMWKTGHSLMKQKMIETGAVVGAEYSGHIFIKDRWFGFDDGLYAAARLLEILSLQGEELDEAFAAYPVSLSTPEIRVPISEARKFEVIEELKEKGNFGEGRLTLLDGLRADYPYGWGLVRASNTGAELTLRFEADDEQSLHKLKSIFVKELRLIDSSIEVNWNQ